MRAPYSPGFLVFLLGFTLWLVFAIKLELIGLTFRKLGLNPESALLLLLTSLFGSAINLPLFSMSATAPPEGAIRLPPGLLRPLQAEFQGRTVVAVNVGGCLVPVLFSIYLFGHSGMPLASLLLAIAIVAGISYSLSRPIPGLGITMPILVAPLAAAIVAILLGGEARAPMAYIAGSLGVLIGADVLRIKDVRHLGAPLASIGGAGTFDGIFMTGLVAVLLT
jgi:uncharacterized membrane protein